MPWTDIVGYLAAFAVLGSFCMSTIVSLRILAIVSNVLFGIYGLLAHLYPVFLLHSILLPINLFKLAQIQLLADSDAPTRHCLWPAKDHEKSTIGHGSHCYDRTKYSWPVMTRATSAAGGELRLPTLSTQFGDFEEGRYLSKPGVAHVFEHSGDRHKDKSEILD